MAKRQTGIWGKFDVLLGTTYLILVLFGWFNIYAAGYTLEHPSIFDFSQEYGKQFIWIGISLAIGFFLLIIEGEIYKQIALPVYGFFILLLIAVLIFGKEVNGAKSWFGIGSFGIQPSEFSKLGVALALAATLEKFNPKDFSLIPRLIAASIILIPAFFILLQPDAGTTLVFLSFILVLYREGYSGNLLLLGILALFIAVLTLLTIKLSWSIFNIAIPGYSLLIAGIMLALVAIFLVIKYSVLPRYRPPYFRNLIVAGILSIVVVGAVNYVYQSDKFLKEHHKNRIDVLFGHKEDPRGVGYNVNQSKIAIGSGGVAGKGFLKGTLTKYKYVPMQSTDFIFCTIGEEWGFIGSSLIVILFCILLMRIIFIAERQRSRFTRIFGYSIAGVFFFHFLVNIGMTIGLAPVIGIPLPFFSYGGSSLMVFSAMIFILLKLDSERLDILR